MTAVADQSRLVPDRLEIDIAPRAPHIGQLLGIGEDRGEGLCDLENVQKAHCKE